MSDSDSCSRVIAPTSESEITILLCRHSDGGPNGDFLLQVNFNGEIRAEERYKLSSADGTLLSAESDSLGGHELLPTNELRTVDQQLVEEYLTLLSQR